MFKLNLVTPYKKIETDLDVSEVIVPGHSGQLDILPGHAPLMTTLETGVVQYTTKDGANKSVSMSWGYCEVSPQSITILAETAESSEEIDKARAEKALQKAQQRLTEAGLTPIEVEKYQRKVKRARVRLDA